MKTERDKRKAASNLKKHRIDFADAESVLYDDQAITISDEGPDEDRFVTLGVDALSRVLVVVYTWRRETLRLISARKAAKRERLEYEARP